MRFDLSKFPVAEQPHIQNVDRSLDNLPRYANTFGLAVDLLNFCRQNRATLPRPLWMGWMGIAGRDGAMTLYHFDETMDGIASSMDQVPTLKANVDRVTERFVGAFTSLNDQSLLLKAS